MQQAKFNISESQFELLNKHSKFGFKNKSAMVRASLEDFKKKLELESLRKSADLYAELYEKDTEVQELTDSAALNWPEE